MILNYQIIQLQKQAQGSSLCDDMSSLLKPLESRSPFLAVLSISTNAPSMQRNSYMTKATIKPTKCAGRKKAKGRPMVKE